jgi:hypothetical protein
MLSDRCFSPRLTDKNHVRRHLEEDEPGKEDRDDGCELGVIDPQVSLEALKSVRYQSRAPLEERLREEPSPRRGSVTPVNVVEN